MNDQLSNIFLKNLHRAVEQNLDDSAFTVGDLSRAVYLSHTQVYRKTKAQTGKPPSLFIRHLRLKKAVELLSDTNLKIADVAFEVGFADPSYFTRVFKKEFGVVPKAFKSL